MVSRDEPGRWTCLARVVAVVLTISLIGCASVPESGRSPSTPYKGDAVYNIASGSRPLRDPGGKTTSHDPSRS